jgi:hypothetical protein
MHRQGYDLQLTQYDDPAHLSAAPTLKHLDQEEEPDGGVLVTVLKDAPLDFRARACTNRLGVGDGRRADRPAGTTPEDTSSTPTMAGITARPRNLGSATQLTLT